MAVTLQLACADSSTAAPTKDSGVSMQPPDAMRVIHDAGNDEQPPPPPIAEFTGVNSTMQLVGSHVEPETCPSGWTELLQALREKGKDFGRLPPLQPDYVHRFPTLRQFQDELVATFRDLGEVLPTTRFSISWPCFMASATTRDEYRDLIEAVQSAGYRLELTLSHRDSYPASLHIHSDPASFLLGGWAHPNAGSEFLTYIDLVLESLDGLVPDGTTIYIANEPIADLLDGYTHLEGKFPPGGRSAGRSLAVAFVNQRDVFREAGFRIREAGFAPAIAPNIRPLVGSPAIEGAELLEYLHWWLTDALVTGCVDDDFDMVCEDYDRPGESAIDRIGITFYGTMEADPENAIDFGLPGSPSQPLARRVFDFTPNRDYFRAAVEATRQRYRDQYEDGTLTIGVAEIGFSSGNSTKQIRDLEDYLDIVVLLGIPFLGIHSIFEHAEFGPGEWYFHLVVRCGPCELTDWGRVCVRTIAFRNMPQ